MHKRLQFCVLVFSEVLWNSCKRTWHEQTTAYFVFDLGDQYAVGFFELVVE